MVSALKQALSGHLLNIPGWHTRRKIVVIESDDWGSIRMPSKEVYISLIEKGINVSDLSYNRYDSLACEDDLSELFKVLHSFKDKMGRHPIFTANTIVANPDFDKIEKSGFTEYYYEPFTETLKRYPKHKKSFEIWKQGINSGVFKPQFHGREHINVKRWMRSLQCNNEDVRLAFKYRMFDLSTSNVISENSFMDALNFGKEEELEFQRRSITEGARLFEQIFGFRPHTFIAPCYMWSSKLNDSINEAEIRSFQGNWIQLEPIKGIENKFKRRFHYTGQLDSNKLTYLVRNAFFEPSDNPNIDWVNVVLSKANIAFKYGKPLIISSHRQNYIGFIDESNRNKNLPLLKLLLSSLLKHWPDIEFLSSDDLSNQIRKSYHLP